MKTSQPIRIRTISEYHRLRQLPPTAHPLISIIDLSQFSHVTMAEPMSFVHDFYAVSLKRHVNAKLKYGQQDYDFNEGSMAFTAPGQVLSFTADEQHTGQMTGWLLLIHPDFLWNTPLAKTIRQYDCFDYAIHEALFLSEKEEVTIKSILQNIGQEYHATIDRFSQTIIIAHLELLLSYAERFYQRQFITRKISNHKTLTQVETILSDYFDNNALAKVGLPTVQYVADKLNVSPNYLSDLLKLLTGQSTQQHIHDKLIEKAKEKLSATDLSVSEIAYALGFEHAQSFSRLFKAKTSLSPVAFRQSFNGVG